MANVLYLAHRLPFPPDKGDKVRTHHILRRLARHHRVLLGTFVDDAADAGRVDALAPWCAAIKAVRLHRWWAPFRAMAGLFRREPLTLTVFRDRRLRAWLAALRQRGEIDVVVVSSSSMAPYAQGLGLPVVMDFIDVDSAKWQAYAAGSRWPWSWVFAREARLLLQFERQVAAQVSKSFFVTRREAQLFVTLAPEAAGRVDVLANGVDATYFAPDPQRASPFAPGETPLVFSGTMSYRPNVDAVVWFAREVLPQLRATRPQLRLTIVGRHPAAEVRALAGEGVRVTGAVDDVRPWLQHAAVVVAPMRIARGVQNKVLEALAMARPVVTAPACAEAIGAEAGVHLFVAGDASACVMAIASLLDAPLQAESVGARARRWVQEVHSWEHSLKPLEAALEAR